MNDDDDFWGGGGAFSQSSFACQLASYDEKVLAWNLDITKEYQEISPAKV